MTGQHGPMKNLIGWFRALSRSQKLVVFGLGLLVLYLLGSSLSNSNQAQKLDLSYVAESETFSPLVGQKIHVHVAGEVKNPGLYQIEIGARVQDAIDIAGGMTKSAFEQSVNLARMVSDGEQIVVLATGQIAQGGSSSGFISLNNATQEQLESLPGVGPAMAERILEHRTAIGSFSDLSQLRDISGIGEKIYAKISKQLTL